MYRERGQKSLRAVIDVYAEKNDDLLANNSTVDHVDLLTVLEHRDTVS